MRTANKGVGLRVGGLSLLSAAAGLVLALIPIPARAVTEAELAWGQWKQKEQAEHMMLLQEERLRASPVERWLDTDIQAYLSQALWVVFYGAALYEKEHGQVPSDLELLVADGYICKWPENPFRGWHPMRVGFVDDGFSAGDICLQVCPPEYYSQLGETSVPYSFELCIYGPDQACSSWGDAVPFPINEAWAVVPEGALFMVGAYKEPRGAAAPQAEANNETN